MFEFLKRRRRPLKVPVVKKIETWRSPPVDQDLVKTHVQMIIHDRAKRAVSRLERKPVSALTAKFLAKHGQYVNSPFKPAHCNSPLHASAFRTVDYCWRGKLALSFLDKIVESPSHRTRSLVCNDYTLGLE